MAAWMCPQRGRGARDGVIAQSMCDGTRCYQQSATSPIDIDDVRQCDIDDVSNDVRYNVIYKFYIKRDVI